MESVADNSGKKNSIQAIASAVTYLQRYTLLAAVGLATVDESDDDGRGAERDYSLQNKWVFSAVGATTVKDLGEVWANGVAEINASSDLEAYRAFKAAVTERKAELEKSNG